jgi:pimeloyl-ACP methyl ester carboxylesterase
VLECGHSPMLEAAADFTAVILEFLGSLGQMHAAGA